MGSDVTDADLVRHEYGHMIQLSKLGFEGYCYFVMGPSISGYWLTKAKVIPNNIYYDLPWEYKANEFGKIHMSDTGWLKTLSDMYWLFSRVASFSG